jgi:hypothetical protein
MMDELRIALAQSGACDVAGTATLARRHRDAWRAEEFEAATMRTGSDPSPPPLEIQYQRGGEGSDPVSQYERRREGVDAVLNAKEAPQ